MKQLSGLDASFLYMETGSQFGHVSSVSIYERPDDPSYDPYTAWRDQIERRLHLLEPLRRRLRVVPFALDHPFWIEDPAFDLDFHVRHNALPPPGSDEQLSELVSRIIGRGMDRDRPLWESYVIEGLPDDRFAILTKVHHATIDGASGAELLTMMLDSDPEGDWIDPPTSAWHGDRMPSDGEMIVRASMSLARKPGRAVLLTTRTVRELGKATRNPALVECCEPGQGEPSRPARRDDERRPSRGCPRVSSSALRRRSSRRRRRSTRRSRRTGASRSGRCRSTRSRRSRRRSEQR